MPTTFDFTANVVADTDPNAGPGIQSASQTVGAHTLTLTGDSGGWVVMDERDFLGQDLVRMHENAFFKDFNDFATKVRLSLDGGKLFDLKSINLFDYMASNNGQFRITTNKGYIDSGPLDAEFSVSFSSSNPVLTGVAWVEISMVDPNHGFSPGIDDIVLDNITLPNVTPTFVGATTSVAATQNGSAVDVAGLLHVSDVDSGQTLTWTQSSGPTHGTLTLSGATAASGNSNITPGGTLTYAPAAGYAGTDSFTVQVSDGVSTSTRTITVSVAPVQPGAPDLAVASDTGASNTDNVTAANAMTFTGTSAAGDTSSTVRVFIDTNNNGAYNAGEATGTAIVNNGTWSVAGINTSALGSGNYNVYSIVTSATGALTSAASTPLAITVDRTPPSITFSGIALSADTGTSPTDFNTATAAQTITATLSGAPGANDVLRGSLDNGATWTTLTSMVSGTTLTWTGATLVPNGGIRLQVLDEHDNAGPTTTKAYTLDTTAPTQTVASAALSADNGSSAGDFITNTAAQTISGSLSGVTASGELVEVSLNNGATWTTAVNTTGTAGWSLAGQTLAGSNTLQVRVTDAAGNHGTAYSQAYVIDTAAPTATVPGGQDLVAPSGGTFTFRVDYADLLAGIDASTFGTGNVTVKDAQNNSLTVTGFAVNGGAVTYTAQAPGGSWDAGDAGAYTIGIVAGSVRDDAGNGVAGNATAGTINAAWSTAPSVSQLALSADTGISNSDFITKTASQTVTATLSKALVAGDKVEGSLDNGTTWTDITSKVSGTTVQWTGVTLAGSGTLVVRASDSNQQAGAAASHAYTLDTAAPAQGFVDVAILSDTGASGTDFITKTAAQNIGGVLSGALGAGEFVEVSLDNGQSWTTANATGTTWSLQGITLPASGTLQVRVADEAGNLGTPWTHAYRVDTAAPTAATPVRADLIDPQAGSFTFTVTYADAGAGIDAGTIGASNVTVSGPAGMLTVSGVAASGNTVTYTVDAPGGSWDALEAGDYTIGITGDVEDMAGNVLAANPSAHTFHVGFRPTATVAVADTALTAGETTTVTIVFSQAVSNFDVSDLTAPNGTLTQLASLDGGVTWTATLTPAANAWALSNAIALNLAQVTGADGTPGSGTVQSNVYAVQTGSAPQEPEEPPPTGTVDGVPVSSTQQTDPGTGLVNNVVTVPIVTSSRPEDPNTPNAALADIPLLASKGGAGAALTVSLPVGTGLAVSGPASLLSNAEALLDLIRRIEQKTAAGSNAQQDMTGEGTSFLDALGDNVLLQTATVTPTVAAATGPATIVIAGTGTGTGTGAGGAAHGIVIDAGQVRADTTLQLDNVAFAAVVGTATLRGGAGQNIVIGDSAAQNIFLGPEDDSLSGGGGDDVLGSAGGNDVLAGDDGNDAIAGGIGNDALAGGSGTDVLQGGRSDRGAWTFTLAADGVLSAAHQTAMFAPAASETVARVELDGSAAPLAFLGASNAWLTDVALLYHGAFHRAADLPGLNFYLGQGSSLAAIAQSFVESPEWAASPLAGGTDAEYVQALYRQVLGRAGEAEGVAHWLGQLAGTNGPAQSRAAVFAQFATSAEHRGHFANGIDVAAATVTAEQGWIAGSGDDRLEGGAGDDLLVGGDGVDTAVLGARQADFSLLVTGGERVVLTSAGSGADTVAGIERGEFTDGTLDLSFTQGAQIETLGLLYQAVLDRAADLPGIAWWAATGLGTTQLAAGFAQSAEFQQRYGGMSDAAFVQALYANSELAPGEAGGAAAWVAYLGQHTRAELIGTWIGQADVIGAQFATPGL